ncbi:MAG: murein biosynthesis integral membrane protein MurJ, partial [Acidimicrobiales bacterium]
WDPRHRAVRTVLALSGWTAGSVLANQVSFYVVQLLAGARGGDVTAFNYAYQFFQLPYAIFAVSIASVISPDLAERWSAGAMRAYRARLGSGIRLTLAILVPAGAGYAVIAGPLLHLALDHGRVSGPEAHLTAVLLAIFALGLPGFSVYLLLMRAYQSMKDTRAMFWRYCAENALTLVAAAALYPALGVRGLALGWIGAYSVVAVTAFAQVARRTGGLQGEALRATAWRVAVASAAMVAALEGLGAVLPGSAGVAVTVVKVCLLAVVGTAVYVLVALWLGVAEVRRVLLVRWSGR